MLASSPSFSDNCRALYEYMQNKDINRDYRYVWLVEKGFIDVNQYRNTIFIQKSSSFSYDWWRYLYHLFTSKYLFSTHSYFTEANQWVQQSVCIWHGTMLKCICKMNEREKNQPVKSQYRWFVSPSGFYNKIVAQSFGVAEDKVLTTGYPRNDFLHEDVKPLERLGIVKPVTSKMVVYMPTFRIPQGGGYNDSKQEASMEIMQLNNSVWLEAFNCQLSELGLFMLVKLHPYDSLQLTEHILSNIAILPHNTLLQKDVQLYHILHHADAMITDYSSIFCDYLVLDRPIAFVVADMEEYGIKRGFVFENPLDYLPGETIRKNEELMRFLEDVSMGIDNSTQKRAKLTAIYNSYCDNNNSGRLLNAVGLNIKH